MIDEWLNRQLAVWRRAETDDNMGGKTTGEPGEVGSVDAKVDQPTAVEQRIAEQMQATLTHSIYLNPGTIVRRGDELRGDGDTFSVLAVVEPSEPVYAKALCERTQQEP